MSRTFPLLGILFLINFSFFQTAYALDGLDSRSNRRWMRDFIRSPIRTVTRSVSPALRRISEIRQSIQDDLLGWGFDSELGERSLCLYPCSFDPDFCFARQGGFWGATNILLSTAYAKVKGEAIEAQRGQLTAFIAESEKALDYVERGYREKHGIAEGEPLPADAPMTQILDTTRDALKVLKDSLANARGSRDNITIEQKTPAELRAEIEVAHDVEGTIGGHYNGETDSIQISTSSVSNPTTYLHEAAHRVYAKEHPVSEDQLEDADFVKEYLFKSETAAFSTEAVTAVSGGQCIGTGSQCRLLDALLNAKDENGWEEVFRQAKRGPLRPYRHLSDIRPEDLSKDLLPPPATVHLGTPPQRRATRTPSRPLRLEEAQRDLDQMLGRLPSRVPGPKHLKKVRDDWLSRGRPDAEYLEEIYSEGLARLRQSALPCTGGRGCPLGRDAERPPPASGGSPRGDDTGDPYERGRGLSYDPAFSVGEGIQEERGRTCGDEAENCGSDCTDHCLAECINANREVCEEEGSEALEETGVDDSDFSGNCPESDIESECESECEMNCESYCEENPCDPDGVEIPELDFDCPADVDEEGVQVQCNVS